MENGRVLHVVMFPWLAIGHLRPFLQLSICLAHKGHRISFISTPRNLQRLPRRPQNLASSINLISIPLPKVENLPADVESSMDILKSKEQLLKRAFDQLKTPITDFLQSLSPKPDWIIYDYTSHWLPEIAAEIGIKRAYFSLFTAAFMAFLGSPAMLLNEEDGRSKPEDFTVVPEWIPLQSNVVFRLHEVIKNAECISGTESGTPDAIRFGTSIDGSDVVLFRTCVELEPDWLNLVHKLYQKPVIPVGVLPPDINEFDSSEKWLEIKAWLDKRPVNSVVYVALGTEATLNEKEINDLALGLEKSGLPFFWVLRNQPGDLKVFDAIPEGFQERVRNRGLVFTEWVPQIKILSHPAVGGLLTHCGWNSVIEGLSFGRVLILFPVLNEQGLNARFLQEKNVGVEIPRNEKDGSFTSDSVADYVRLAMVSEEGNSLRENAREIQSLLTDKNRNNSYIDSFVNFLLDKK